MFRRFVIRNSSLILVSGFVILVCGIAPASRPTLDLLRGALAFNYGDPDAHLALAKALQQQGDSLTAFQICEDARQLFGGELFIASFNRVFLGHDLPLAHARGEVLQTALKLDPNNPALLREMADVWVQQGQDDRAARYYRRAAEVTPNDFSIITALAASLLAMGQEHESQSVVDQWCDHHPDAQATWERNVRTHLKENRDDAPAMLDAAIVKFPDDGALKLMRGQLLLDLKRDNDAEVDLTSAASLSSDSADAQGAAARFYLKIRSDESKALPFYLKAYFLNPDYNDWERVSVRIRQAATDLASAQQHDSNSAAASLETTFGDRNPFVVSAAIDRAGMTWDDRVAEPLLRQLTADAPEVRQAAMSLLLQHVDSHLAVRLQKLLGDPNPLMRAAAATLVAHLSKEAAVPDLMRLLSDGDSFVRFMTAEALIQDGAAAGRAAVRAHQISETDAWVRSAIDASLAAE